MPNLQSHHGKEKRNGCRSAKSGVWFCCVGLFSVMILTGCEVMIGGQKRPLVRSRPIRGSVELEAEMSDDRQKTVNTDTKNKTIEMRELLRLETRGDVYHPNLFLYNAMVGFGLSQSRFDSNGEVSSDHGTVSEYRIGGQLLPTKPYPSSFFLARSDDTVPRLFGSPLKVESETRGFTQSLDLENWPMTFSYSDNYTKQEGSGDTDDRDFFQIDEKNFNYLVMHDFTKLSRMQFEYDRREVTQERFQSLTDRLDDRFTLRHTHFFDEQRRYRFESYFNFLEQSKDFDLDQTLWTERLRLRHTDQFETFYNFVFSESNRAETSSDNTRLETGFRHGLYESLNTTGRLFTTENNNNDITEDIWGGDMSFDYIKNNQWGRLYGSYLVGYQNLDQTGGSTIATIIDEKHLFTLAGSFRFFLDQPNVDASSIDVWNSTRAKLYIENTDYTVSEIDGITEIQILPAGDIPTDGDQLLSVDYNYLTEPERKEESLTQIFTIRQVFNNGIGVYYEYHIRDQDFTTSDTDFVPDEYIKNIVGADYINGGLRLEAEYRDEDTTRLPLIRKHLSGSYFWPLDQDTQLSFYASNDWIEYTDESNEIVQFTVGGELFARLTDRYRVISTIVYRDEDDDRQGKTQGLNWNTELRYVFRQLTYSTGLEMSFLDHLDQETDNLYLYFRARREF